MNPAHSRNAVRNLIAHRCAYRITGRQLAAELGWRFEKLDAFESLTRPAKHAHLIAMRTGIDRIVLARAIQHRRIGVVEVSR